VSTAEQQAEARAIGAEGMILGFAKDLLNNGNLRIEPHLAKVCSNIAAKPDDASSVLWCLSRTVAANIDEEEAPRLAIRTRWPRERPYQDHRGERGDVSREHIEIDRRNYLRNGIERELCEAASGTRCRPSADGLHSCRC